MFCTQCGSEVQQHARFCSKCGHEISTTLAPVSQGPPKKAPPDMRGDLKAVVRAILLDTEAISDTSPELDRGHLKHPVLLITNLLRAFKAGSADLSTMSDGYLNPQSQNMLQWHYAGYLHATARNEHHGSIQHWRRPQPFGRTNHSDSSF